ILEVQKVERDCTDNRRSKSFYSITSNPWKIGPEEVVTVDLINEEEKGCYYDCNISIFSNDEDTERLVFPLRYGTDPVKSGVFSNISTDGENFKVVKGKEAVIEITIENKDCLEMTDPQIYLSPIVNTVYDGEGLPSLNLKIVNDSIKIVDGPAGFEIGPDTGGARIYLSGKLDMLEKVKISFTVNITTLEECFFDEGYYLLDYSFKHKDMENETYMNQAFEFYCSEAENTDSNESTDKDNNSIKGENTSSGCAMGI
ncbi:MAG TPA: hypothetical protein P5044_08510, partial [bacterium]|nr:hypothetical protein [bacterium]